MDNAPFSVFCRQNTPNFLSHPFQNGEPHLTAPGLKLHRFGPMSPHFPFADAQKCTYGRKMLHFGCLALKNTPNFQSEPFENGEPHLTVPGLKLHRCGPMSPHFPFADAQGRKMLHFGCFALKIPPIFKAIPLKMANPLQVLELRG